MYRTVRALSVALACSCLLLLLLLPAAVESSSSSSSSSSIRSRCREGDEWYYLNGNCYYWSNRTEGWFGAEKHCQELGGHLVSIGSRAENSFLHALAQCDYNFWIGMVKTDVRRREFTWWDNSRNNFTELMSIRTNDYFDCMYFETSGSSRWYNTVCQALNNYVCMTSTPVLTETDLQQQQQQLAGPDSQDVTVKCPDDWLSLESNCYFVSSEKTNYFNAQMSCEAKGATVANVMSAREQTLITMALGCNIEAWIGLEKVRPCISNPSLQFCWTWMDQTPLSYTNWQSGYPSSIKEVECAVTDGRWKTTNCYNEYRYICKKK